MRIIYELKRKVAYLERQIVRLKAGNEETSKARRNHYSLAFSPMDTIEIGELRQQIADFEKKVRNLEWEKVRLKAGHEAISQVRCKAIVQMEKDTERLDWLDKNMTSLDSVQTFGKEIPVGELRQYVDAAIQKEEQP